MYSGRLARSVIILAFVLSLAVPAALKSAAPGLAQTPPALSSNAMVFATGLNSPRGLRFGPDGNLYVAEAGYGGAVSTATQTMTAAGMCSHKPGNASLDGGYTARISEITPAGQRITFVDSLPSGVNATGTSAFGVADLEFSGGTLYALLVGGGCDHGNVDVPASVIQVNPDSSWTIVADLSAFERANPVHTPDLSDYDPDGTWYSLTSVNGDIFAVNPNGSEVDRISPTSVQIHRLLDMSSEPWIGPTSIVYHDGSFYFGTLGEFPVHPGTQSIYRMTPDGTVTTYASGLTAVLGLTFDGKGRLFALESMTAAGFPGPKQIGTGKVVQVTSSGLQTVATGLSLASAITAGPNGDLYVSNFGFGLGPGAGQIVRISVP